MMAGWFTSTSQLDEQIEKATSSSLVDIEISLEISDLIRSKAVASREAMRSLKKRLENKNPNIQIGTLNLTDICVKNGGSHFLSEIASKEYMDNLVSLLKAHGGIALNQDVKTKILELIQCWATATEDQSEFSYIKETYGKLMRDGFHFAPIDEVAKSMLVSYTPPEWIDSDVCMRCRAAFTFRNRKHHCRNCGNAFDHQCSSKTLPLLHLGISQAVRVDDGCYEKLTSKSTRRASVYPERSPTFRQPHQHRSQSLMQPRSARVDDIVDDDLKIALAMSLEEVKGHSGESSKEQPTLSTRYTNTNNSDTNKFPKIDEDEDEDLKTAIAASIADMEKQKKKHFVKIKDQDQASGKQTVKNFALNENEYTLTPFEVENISLFSNLVDRLQSQPPGAVLKEPQIQELYENIVKLRPKLARTYGETVSKHESLLELHAKLSTVVRYYDRLLEQRLSNTYSPSRTSNYNTSQRPLSNLYPNTSSSMNGSTEDFYTSKPQVDEKLRVPFVHNSHPNSSLYDKQKSNSTTETAPADSVYAQFNPPQRTSSWRASDPSRTFASRPSLATDIRTLSPISAPQQMQQANTPQPQNIYDLSGPQLMPVQNPHSASYYNQTEPYLPKFARDHQQQLVSQSNESFKPAVIQPSSYQQSATNLPIQHPNQQGSLNQEILSQNQQNSISNQYPSQLQSHHQLISQEHQHHQSTQQFTLQQQQQHQKGYWQQQPISIQQQQQAPLIQDKYNQTHFPSPPQHTLQQPNVEECLIEL